MLQIRETPEYSEWIEAVRDERAQARIVSRVARLARGNAGDVKPVGQGVSELRVHYGPGYRVYFTRRGLQLIVLLCGGDKSTQEKDVERAKLLAATWTDEEEK